MSKPLFITFTGADDQTDIDAMIALSAQYPIEWGILFSPDRQGNEPRYPDINWVAHLLCTASPTLDFAAHLCGGHSRALLARRRTDFDNWLSRYFDRVQINTAMRGIDTRAVATWADSLGVKPILQCRDSFPDDRAVGWLFDASGGRGIAPASWPRAPHSSAWPIGFAGGLGPDNIANAIIEIEIEAGTIPYWIDMESGVRTDDKFDLAKCRAVCEAVFGKAAE